MAIVAQCGACGQQFQLGDQFAGKRFKCKSCGGVVQAPSNEPLATDPLGGFPSNQPAPLSPQQPVAPMQGGFETGQPGQLQGAWGGTPQPVAPAKPGGFPKWAIAAIGGCAGLLVLVILLIIVLFAFFATGSSDEDLASSDTAASGTNSTSTSTSTTSTDSGEVIWQVTADRSSNPVGWPATLSLDIPFPKSTTTVLMPTTDSPYAALVGAQSSDAELWNLKSGKKVGTLSGCTITYSNKEYALSPDGKYMVVARASGGSGKVAEIWSWETGELLKKITCDDAKMSLSMVDFAGPGQLLALTQGSTASGFEYRYRALDIASEKLLHQFNVARDQKKNTYAFSPGRRYLAAYSNSVVDFFDLKTGKTVGKWKLEDYDSTANVFASMNFSPDGKQLAFVLSGTNTNLILIDMTTGKTTDNIMVAGISPISSAYNGETIEWLPGGQGWCINGATIIDATSKRIVWNFQIKHLSHSLNSRRTLTGGWITSDGPYNDFRIKFVPAPWAQIKSSVAAFNANGPATLKPGMSVSLDIEVGTLRFGTPESTKNRLADAFTKQFKSGNINVADNQPVVLKLHYSEEKGKELTFRQLGTIGGSPNDGKKIAATIALIKMSLQSADGATAYWSGDVKIDPTSVVIKGAATEESLHESLFNRLPWTFAAQPIPFFVPQNNSTATLPGATVLESK